MNKTNLTKELKTRNWERKYGTISAIILSVFMFTLLTLIYTHV